MVATSGTVPESQGQVDLVRKDKVGGQQLVAIDEQGLGVRGSRDVSAPVVKGKARIWAGGECDRGTGRVLAATAVGGGSRSTCPAPAGLTSATRL